MTILQHMLGLFSNFSPTHLGTFLTFSKKKTSLRPVVLNKKGRLFFLCCPQNPGSQPPLQKWWFPLEDDKPLLKITKIVVVREPTYKKWWLDFQGKGQVMKSWFPHFCCQVSMSESSYQSAKELATSRQVWLGNGWLHLPSWELTSIPHTSPAFLFEDVLFFSCKVEDYFINQN